MKGLTQNGVRSIEDLVKKQFNLLSLRFLGIIPTPLKDKSIIFKTTRNNLVSLFLQALQSRSPNALEERSLKTMLRLANGYMDALRDRTTTRVAHDVDAYVKNQSMKKQPLSMKKVNSIVSKEMGKAGNHVRLIANAESQKAINTGTALQISKVGKSRGEDDPIVFFIVTVDDVTGPEEFVLHLLPDRKTPRVWRLSEIGAEYHKKGDANPKLPGLHPNCRCKLTYMAKGFGFDESGRVKYIDKNHDEFEAQRKEYGLPR